MGVELASGALSARVNVRRRARRCSFQLDVSIEVAAGITILFGPSGAGKSTLLDCIAGLLRPDSGRVSIGDKILFDSTAHANLPPQKRGIAYVFQSLALFPRMSVEENVGYGLADLPAQERASRVRAILAAFRVETLCARRPDEISGGEKQRVALARSLVTEPLALLLDEPLSALDSELKASIINDLRTWNTAQKIPMLYVTHSRDEVEALGERVILLDRGRVTREGSVAQLFDPR
jgi:molybdate transport system ATP-binding protein